MKILILLAAIFSISLAENNFNARTLNMEYLEFEPNEELIDEFLRKLEAGDDDITAAINEYVDTFFQNIGTMMVKNNLDPLSISDVEEEFLTASITLTNGHINGVSAIQRSDDVTLSYNSGNKVLDARFPVVFSNLNFTYDYHVIILLIGPKGTLVGKIEDLKVDFKLQFDFNTYHVTLEEINTTNKGHLSVTIHGNAVVDVVVNILSEFATTVLQPWIGSEIQKHISSIAQTVIETINNTIDDILSPTTDVLQMQGHSAYACSQVDIALNQIDHINTNPEMIRFRDTGCCKQTSNSTCVS